MRISNFVVLHCLCSVQSLPIEGEFANGVYQERIRSTKSSQDLISLSSSVEKAELHASSVARCKELEKKFRRKMNCEALLDAKFEL